MPHRLALAATSIAAALSACGSDRSPDAIRNEPLEIRAIDYAYVDVPSTMRAGSSLALVNESEVEAHELVAVRLDDDDQRSVDELVQLPPDEFAALFSEVRTVLLAAPSSDAVAVVGDGTLTDPGRYVLVCVIPTGADPEDYLAQAATSDGPPDVAGGPPHIARGMFAELTVTT